MSKSKDCDTKASNIIDLHKTTKAISPDELIEALYNERDDVEEFICITKYKDDDQSYLALSDQKLSDIVFKLEHAKLMLIMDPEGDDV